MSILISFILGLMLHNPITKMLSKVVPFISMLEIKYSLWNDKYLKCYYCGANPWTIDDAFHDQQCSQLFCSICNKSGGHTRRVCCNGHTEQREKDLQKLYS